MKKSTHFEWNDQADQAFHELKKMLATPPVLAAPTEKGPMLYIAATSRVVSTVIVVQRPEVSRAQPV